MKIKKIKGKKYSRESFEGYKLRANVLFRTATELHYVDIYTTETDEEKIWDRIMDFKIDKVKSFSITHLATKEQDDLSSIFIDEWLMKYKYI
jgi:hypothetical protein